MTQNNADRNPPERFTTAGSELTQIFLDQASEQGLENTALHAMLTTAIDETASTRRIAAATGAATSEAATALETLRQQELMGHGAAENHYIDRPWYLTAAGEASDEQLMKPSQHALDAAQSQMGNESIKRITQALERATSAPPNTSSIGQLQQNQASSPYAIFTHQTIKKHPKVLSNCARRNPI